MRSSDDRVENRDHLRTIAIECYRELVHSLNWTVKDGEHVEPGQEIATLGVTERGTFSKIVAPNHGTLRYDRSSDTTSSSGTSNVPIAYIEFCIHPLMSGRTCMMCLAIVSDEELVTGTQGSVNIVSQGHVLRLNSAEASTLYLLNAKKLSLVLDLDHTLLHAVEVTNLLVKPPTASDEIHYFHLPGMKTIQYVVKLRPGLHQFLKSLSEQYDLCIYTHGTRTYAEAIAGIIDPNDTFFRHRIVARTDTPDIDHKSLKLLFPSCDDSMILILDDRLDVWKVSVAAALTTMLRPCDQQENEGNVILIKPFHYFSCLAEVNNMPGDSTSSSALSPDKESASEHTKMDIDLEYILKILQRIHQAFYQDPELVRTVEVQMSGRGSNVKQILAQEQRKILQGCSIVFSGVFPVVDSRGPETHSLWRLAADMGAVPSLEMDDFPLTHLVIHPMRLGTQKHVKARETPHVHIVTPDWLVRSARIWHRAPEADFLAEKIVTKCSTEPGPSVDPAEPVESIPPSEKEDALGIDRDKPIRGILRTGASTQSEEAKEAVRFDPNTKEPKNSSKKFIEKYQRARTRKQFTNSANSTLAPKSKGTVANGETFDFLSKISTMRARDRKGIRASVPKAVHAQRRSTTQPKDVDETFAKLIEAEESEQALEEERQQSTLDIKAQLAARRRNAKRHKQEHHDPMAESSGSGSDLDSLEQDIFGSFE
ncbi:unnamed protein product [Albugo candida]|uniref:protein-serine/threonine phosphatase n=1 Tax=Albugo candida TaxID=65357 RepID=A0A024G1M2_9STRA|nr:unnamed protein product [Albugo candida]|eukprot:CCI40748.1 unnamed protein product [Albugo candida]